MTKHQRKTHCEMCGKEFASDLYYRDYCITRMDGKGDTKLEFDICEECLPKLIEIVERVLEHK